MNAHNILYSEALTSEQGVGTRMRHVRMVKGLRQKQVASDLDVSMSHYSKVEVGINHPSRKLIKHFCAVFGVDWQWLLTGRGDPFLSVNEEAEAYGNRLLGSSARQELITEEFLEKAADEIAAMLAELNFKKLRDTAEELEISFEKILRLKVIDCLHRKFGQANQ